MAFVDLIKQKNNKYIEIENDVMELNRSMQILNSIVNEQQESIDSIDDFIQISKEDTKKAYEELKTAKVYNDSYNYNYFTLIVGGIATGLLIFLKT
jgi:t-SNARE domain-containing protein 1